MQYFTLATLIMVGCGSGGAEKPDLAVAAEPDLSAVPILLDLSVGADLTVLADLTVAACTTPQPGVYNEIVSYAYALAGGGPTMYATSSSMAVVRNNGTFMRPSDIIAGPTFYHCDFTTIDPVTCLAPCCPGQALSPVMYFDKNGWIFWMSGTCAFQTNTGAQYIAQITDVEGYFSR